jgi:hypothetical protein
MQLNGLIYLVGEDTIEFWGPLFRLASLAGNQDAKYTYAQMLRLGMNLYVITANACLSPL